VASADRAQVSEKCQGGRCRGGQEMK